MRTPAAVALLLFVAAPSAEAAFTREPWVQNAEKDRVAIYWEAGSNGGTQRLEYGTGGAFDQSVNGTNVQFNLYKAEVTGLPASRSYEYRVVSNADTSPAGTFTTAPADAEPFRFGAYGDNRSDASAHATVVAEMLAHAPDFVINAGDLVNYSTYTEFFSIEKDLLRNAPIFPAPGNHDFASFYQFGFDRPNWYSFKWGNAFFICVSTNDDYSSGSTQYQWVESQLQAAQQDTAIDWVIVFHHFPVYSSANHGSTPGMQTSLNVLYKQYAVDLVVNSHDHVYERVEKDGVEYIVTGGGGAPLYSFDAPVDGSLVRVSATHVVIVDVDGGVLDLNAYKTDGSLIDTWHKEKTPGPTPTPTGTGTPGPTPTPGNPGDPGNGGGGCAVGGSASATGSLLLGLVALLALRRRQ